MFDYENQKPLHEYSAYFGNDAGKITVYNDGIVIRTGRRDIPVRANYVESVNPLAGEALLGKISVELSYFDMFGNSDTYSFAMHANDFRIAKASLGK